MNYKVFVNKDNPISNDYLNSMHLVDYNGIMVEKKALNMFKLMLNENNLDVNIIKAYTNDKRDEHVTGLLLDINKDIDSTLLEKYGFIKEEKSIRYTGKSTAKIINDNKLTLEKYNEFYNKSFLVLVNKPSSITSFDVCEKVGKIFDTKKVGHTGTLDPLASGLMLVLVNKYTKLNNLINYDYKEYIAVVEKGIETDTLDITGKVLKQKNKIMIDDLKDVLESFKGKYMQEVPIYSAVKINGKKLYEYARENKTIDLPKREVEIKDIELIEEDNNSFKFRCLVSKGTYIRSLIRDIGTKINYPLTMKSLLRTKEGKFKLDDSIKLSDININSKKLYLKDIFDYEILDIDDDLYKSIINGVKVKVDFNGKRLIKYNDEIIGIVENINGYISKKFIDI